MRTLYHNTCVAGHYFQTYSKWRKNRWWKKHQHPELRYRSW